MGKVGRPTSFDQKIAAKICEALAEDRSLASICAEAGMPSTTTVYRWRDANEQFRADYARAREAQGHVVADTVGELRRKIVTGEIDWQVGKAAADLAKWEAGKRAARDFGDKVDVTSGGEPIGEIDDTTRAIRIASVLGRIGRDDSADHSS